MDSLSDREVESIWERSKKYINVSRIRASDLQGLAQEIEREMQTAREAPDKAGSMQTLVKKGFPKRAAELFEVRKLIKGAKTPIEKVLKPRKRKKVKVLPAKITKRPKGKLAIKTRKGIRIHAAKNIKITRGRWRGRNAYWVFNLRQKKLVTWGTKK